MSKMSSPSAQEIQEKKKVSSICLKHDFSTTQEVRKEDKYESAKAEMGEVKEENERLKMLLERVEKDYHSLQLRFFDIVNKEASKKGVVDSSNSHVNDDETEEEPELVSLSLGRSPKKEAKIIENSKKPKEKELLDFEAKLSLGLDTKNFLSMEVVSDLSPTNSSEEPIKEAEAESTNKSAKATNANNNDISDQVPAKRARVSVRARCDTPTMNDGCQWRKYGQKIAKGNPCPRAYYRCTVAPSCPVRKQVQRCAEDLSILITTYEGEHNHPLPVSATAMASTTSAAASMLLSGSSTSNNPPPYTSSSFPNSSSLFNGLSFSEHFDEQRAKHVFFPPNNHASSQQHLFPTITLDLTSPSSSLSIASNTRFSPTSLNFYSPESNFMPSSSIWGKGHVRQVIPGNSFQFQEQFYQQCMTKTNHQTPSREALAETITKAISTDPSLRSVIAAAVSSMVGQGSNKGEGLSLKLGENPQLGLSNNGYFKRLSSSTNSQGGNMMLLQPTLPFSLSKSSSTTTTHPPSLVNNQINHFVLPEMNTHH